jgi:hypothetical protein
METTRHKKVLEREGFEFPLIKTSGTYLNTTPSLLEDEQTSKHGGGCRYYAN